jgi:hypothetical protein
MQVGRAYEVLREEKAEQRGRHERAGGMKPPIIHRPENRSKLSKKRTKTNAI